METYNYVLAGAAGLFITLILRAASRGPLSHIPGPWYTKFTSWPLRFYWLLGKKAAYVHRLHVKYGPVIRITPDEADLCDVSAKQTIYSTKETFVKTSFYDKLSGWNEGLFSTRNIDTHRHLRRLLSGPMSDNSLRTVEPLVRRRVDLTIHRMVESMQTKGFVDVFHWAFLMTSDIIGELSFGESFGNLEAGTKGQYLNDVLNIGWAGGICVAFPWLFQYRLLTAMTTVIPAVRSVLVSIRRITQYAHESLARYRWLVDEDPVNVKPTLFTKLFKAGEEEALSFEMITQSARTYLVAGSDTTANTLTYLIWSVCKDQAIRDKLVAELTTKLLETNTFSDADVRQLPYLNCVIEEALRLYTAVPSALPRAVPAQGAELAGYWFPGGVTVASQAYSLHRDPAIYPNPFKFDPDRWTEGRANKLMKDASLAWGGGSRICIGMHLAKTEIRLTTALFFRTFPKATVSTAEGMSDKDMEIHDHFLLALKGGRCHIGEE
ncbi:Cytochrome P450 [Rhypophila decipiens]